MFKFDDMYITDMMRYMLLSSTSSNIIAIMVNINT